MLPELPEFNKEQRKFFADKIMDAANIGIGALVFGNLVSGKVDLTWLVVGVVVYYFCFTVSHELTKGDL